MATCSAKTGRHRTPGGAMTCPVHGPHAARTVTAGPGSTPPRQVPSSRAPRLIHDDMTPWTDQGVAKQESGYGLIVMRTWQSRLGGVRLDLVRGIDVYCDSDQPQTPWQAVDGTHVRIDDEYNPALAGPGQEPERAFATEYEALTWAAQEVARADIVVPEAWRLPREITEAARLGVDVMHLRPGGLLADEDADALEPEDEIVALVKAMHPPR